MSISIIDTLKPLGNYPVVESSDVQVGSERLSTVLNNLPSTAYVNNAVSGKVDKVEGKGLSDNNYSATDKTKLDSIEANANNYVHPTTSGYKHIPSGGSTGQVLGWSADGTALWVDTDKSVLDAVTPEMYGAIGDGLTDDTAALNSMFASGRNIEFPHNKVYGITNTLVLSGNQIIHGNNSTIKFISQTAIADTGLLTGSDNIKLYDLILDGNIQNTNVSEHTFSNTVAEGMDGWRGGEHDILIENCIFNNIQKMGIVINTNDGNNIVIRNNTFNYTNRDGCFVTANNVIVENNKFYNCHDNAVAFDAWYGDTVDFENYIVRNNIVYPSDALYEAEKEHSNASSTGYNGRSSMCGFFARCKTNAKVKNISCSNNVFSVTYNGIQLKNAENCLISNNIIYAWNTNSNLGSNGIELNNVSKSSILSNYVRGAESYGFVDTNGLNNIISNNNFIAAYKSLGIMNSTNDKVTDNVLTNTQRNEAVSDIDDSTYCCNNSFYNNANDNAINGNPFVQNNSVNNLELRNTPVEYTATIDTDWATVPTRYGLVTINFSKTLNPVEMAETSKIGNNEIVVLNFKNISETGLSIYLRRSFIGGDRSFYVNAGETKTFIIVHNTSKWIILYGDES